MVQVDPITGFGSGQDKYALRRYAAYLAGQGNVSHPENDFGAVNVDAMLGTDPLNWGARSRRSAAGVTGDTHQPDRHQAHLPAMGLTPALEPQRHFDVICFWTCCDDPLTAGIARKCDAIVGRPAKNSLAAGGLCPGSSAPTAALCC